MLCHPAILRAFLRKESALAHGARGLVGVARQLNTDAATMMLPFMTSWKNVMMIQ